MVLDIAHHQTVLVLSIDEMAKALWKRKLSLIEIALAIAILAVAYLLKEAISACIHDYKTVVGGVCDNEELIGSCRAIGKGNVDCLAV